MNIITFWDPGFLRVESKNFEKSLFESLTLCVILLG